MEQIRKNVFETNSSSTHSLVMSIKSDFDKWKNGEVLYCNHWSSFRHQDNEKRFKSGNFYPRDEVEAYYEEIGDERDPSEFCTYDEFIEDEYLEVESYSYTTPSGEVVEAVAKYGYEG